MLPQLDQVKVAVIGLGYVGLPLAVELAKKYVTIGFDVNAKRIEELCQGRDITNEVESDDLKSAQQQTGSSLGVTFTADTSNLGSCNVYIVTVPTPIDGHNQPDLTPLIKASTMLGNFISKNDVVIYESTVYPGLTEERCVPVLEEGSGLRLNQDFFVGYSPERINPGDMERRLPSIKKVTSGSTDEAAEFVNNFYAQIITAGTYKASSIKVAEAAKVIENTQRDVNIALMNELAMIFSRLGIDTDEVLKAAGTKWNFLPFKPGLVGGHCIGVDPYYLTYKALEIGYHPEIILAGRRLNDNMASYIVSDIFKMMTKKRIQVVDSKVLILGLTFKENCPDVRNTKVVDVIDELLELNAAVDVYDPWVNPDDVKENGFKLISAPEKENYDAIILAVAHSDFMKMGVEEIKKLGKSNHVIYDVKSVFDADLVDGRL